MLGALARYEAPIPSWLGEVKEEVRQKAIGTTLIPAMQRGEPAAIHAFFIGFWSFVDDFPGVIQGKGIRMFRQMARTTDAQALTTIGASVGTAMKQDEEKHRTLWVRGAHTVGIENHVLAERKKSYPKTQHITELVGAKKADLAVTLLRFVAVEMVAETVSAEVLSSEWFRLAVGEGGLGWFWVHVKHVQSTEDTHEAVAFRLANALTEDGVEEQWARKIILEVADVFAEAANAAYAIAS